MMWIPAIIVSHLTGGQDLNKLNIKLLSPFIQKMLPQKYRPIEMRLIDSTIGSRVRNEVGTRNETTELITPHYVNVSSLNKTVEVATMKIVYYLFVVNSFEIKARLC